MSSSVLPLTKPYTSTLGIPASAAASSHLQKSKEIERNIKYDILKESDRLRTFENWQNSYVSGEDLALFGFFHVGGDRAKCAFCGVVVSGWEPGDTALGEHLKHSNRCPFLSRRNVGNCPINAQRLNQLLPPVSYDTCGTRFSVKNEFKLEENRIKSFKNWPQSINQKPEQLAEVGFFYTGRGDIVECFSCGITIKDWHSEDDPLREHAIRTEKCDFLNLLKGYYYVDRVKAAVRQKRRTKSISKDAEQNGTSELDKLCKICLHRTADILFMPCFHCATCASCSVSCEKCPICRHAIESRRKIFFS